MNAGHKPDFPNRPNECINHEERQYWISRSVAVVAMIVAIWKDKTYILLDRRGPGTPDFQGMWNLPCGYLDWNETSRQAIWREVFEETGLDIERLIVHHDYEPVMSKLDQPWLVWTDPSANRQNVTLHHALIFRVKDGAFLPHLSNQFCEPDEVSAVRWVPAYEALHSYQLAFNHAERIAMFIKKYIDELPVGDYNVKRRLDRAPDISVH